MLQELIGICFPCIFVCICGDFWQSVYTDFGIAKLFYHFLTLPLLMLIYHLMWHSTCIDSSNWWMLSGITAIQGWSLSGFSWSSPVLTYLISLACNGRIFRPAVSLYTLSKQLWIQVCFWPSATKNLMIACFYCTSVFCVRINLVCIYWVTIGKCLRMIKDFTDVDISIKEECKETKK